MSAMVLRRFGVAAFSLLNLAGAATSGAVTLDWDTATWTNGSTTGSVNGVDVNITPSAPGLFQPSLPSPNPPTPAVTRAFDGGLTVGEKTLELAVDLPNNGSGNFVTVTLTFNSATYVSGVSGISFKLFDIDSSNVSGNTFQDRVFNITATTLGGATLTPTISNLGSAVTNSGGVLTGNLGVSANDTGTGSGAGNAQIDFGGSYIRSITFSYGSTGAFADPTYQHIGLYDITFTPVPEINPSWSAVLSCIAAAGLVLRHRVTTRK